jgi:hypothetical protein
MAGDNHGSCKLVCSHRLGLSSLLVTSLERLPLRRWRLFPLDYLPDGLSVQAAESQLHDQDLSSQHQC